MILSAREYRYATIKKDEYGIISILLRLRRPKGNQGKRRDTALLQIHQDLLRHQDTIHRSPISNLRDTQFLLRTPQLLCHLQLHPLSCLRHYHPQSFGSTHHTVCASRYDQEKAGLQLYGQEDYAARRLCWILQGIYHGNFAEVVLLSYVAARISVYA